MPFIETSELPIKEPLPGWKGRYFNSESMTFGYYAVAAGASIHEHEHPNEEVWHVIESSFRVAGLCRPAFPGGRPARIPLEFVHRTARDGLAAGYENVT